MRMLTVSRIDPRKGLRVLPEAVRLLRRCAASTSRSTSSGRPSGGPAKTSGAPSRDAATRSASADRVSLLGAVPLDQLAAALSRLRPLRAADAAGRRHSARAARGDGGRSAGRDDARRRHSEPGDARAQRAAASTRPSADAVADAVARLVARRRAAAAADRATATRRRARITLEAQAARMMRDVSARLGLHVAAAGDGAGRVSAWWRRRRSLFRAAVAERRRRRARGGADSERARRDALGPIDVSVQREGPYLAEVDRRRSR